MRKPLRQRLVGENPQTPYENHFFEVLQRFTRAKIERQKELWITRKVDGYFRGDESGEWVFDVLGLPTRGRDVYVEHMSTSVTWRTLERFRNILQEHSTARASLVGAIFARRLPFQRIHERDLVPCQHRGIYALGPRLMGRSTLELYVVVPHHLPRSTAYLPWRYAMAQTAKARMNELQHALQIIVQTFPDLSFTEDAMNAAAEIILGDAPPTKGRRRGFSFSAFIDFYITELERHPQLVAESPRYQELIKYWRDAQATPGRMELHTELVEMKIALDASERQLAEAQRRADEERQKNQSALESTLALAAFAAPELVPELRELNDPAQATRRLTEHLQTQLKWGKG